MINYIEYIYRGFFHDFQFDHIELLDDFFKDIEKKKLFHTSETYQLAIISLIDKNDIYSAKEILALAKQIYSTDSSFLIIEAIIEKGENPKKALNLCDKYYKEYDENIFILIKTIALFNLRQYEKGDKIHNNFVKKFVEEEMMSGAYFHIALLLNSDRYEVLDEPEIEFMVRSMVITHNVERALKHHSDSEFLLQYASGFYSMDNIQEAKTIVNKVIDIDAYNKQAWVMLSEILFEDEQYTEAAEAYKYRITINDGDNMNYFNCGICYFKLGKWNEALHYFKLQERKFPLMLTDNKELYGKIKNSQADCLMKLGEFEKALDICLNILKIDANNFNSMVKAAQCYNFLNNNNLAVVLLGKALKIHCNYEDGDYENLFETSGDIFVEISEGQEDIERKENIKNAISAYTQSLLFSNIIPRNEDRTINSKDIENVRFRNSSKMFKIGRAYALIDDYVNALVNFQLAYQENPFLPNLSFFLTICYFRLRFYKEALRFYEIIPAEEMEYAKTFFPNFEDIERVCRSK